MVATIRRQHEFMSVFLVVLDSVCGAHNISQTLPENSSSVTPVPYASFEQLSPDKNRTVSGVAIPVDKDTEQDKAKDIENDEDERMFDWIHSSLSSSTEPLLVKTEEHIESSTEALVTRSQHEWAQKMKDVQLLHTEGKRNENDLERLYKLILEFRESKDDEMIQLGRHNLAHALKSPDFCGFILTKWIKRFFDPDKALRILLELVQNQGEFLADQNLFRLWLTYVDKFWVEYDRDHLKYEDEQVYKLITIAKEEEILAMLHPKELSKEGKLVVNSLWKHMLVHSKNEPLMMKIIEQNPSDVEEFGQIKKKLATLYQ
ncbi:hypothetical protein Plhal304r1_c070g0159291 [Plasmopara halstedii]